MLKFLDRIIPGIRLFLKVLIVAVGIVMLVTAWAHVFCRYVLNSSLTWSEEFMKFLLVWFCLMSTSVIALERGHVSIVIFKKMMPKELEKLFTLVAQVLLYVVSVMVVYIGIRQVVDGIGRSTPATGLPYPLLYAAIPFSFFFISIYELRNVLSDLKDYREGKTIGKVNDVYAAIEAGVEAEANKSVEQDSLKTE